MKSIYSKKDTHALIDRIKDGDKSASQELTKMYEGLIHKTVNILYERYNGLVTLNTLKENAYSIFLYLAVIEYDPVENATGRARFPWFMKQYLHARLTQLCRPIVKYNKNTVHIPLELFMGEDSTFNHVANNERKEVFDKLQAFMLDNLTEKELDVVTNHVMCDKCRNTIAREYGVSNQRMYTVQKRAMVKLKKFLYKLGINKLGDI